MKRTTFHLARRVGAFCCLAAAAALLLAHAPAAPASAASPTRGKPSFGPEFPDGSVPKPPQIRSHAAVLMEAETGRLLFQLNAFQRRAPASTTKIMTAIVALERGNLNDVVTVSKYAASIHGSSMRLRAGMQYTLDDLLYGMLMLSGNDAATAIAEHIGGSVQGFAELMNRKAVEIGAVNSHFVNPHGLDHPNHYTTAYDLAVMTRYAMRLPYFAQAVSTRSKTVSPENQPREWTLSNTNRLLWSYEGASGVKTGTTGSAGNCLVASATRDSVTLYSVVLNSGNRWNDSARLLDWGFQTFAVVPVLPAGNEVTRVPVLQGMRADVAAVAGEPLTVVVPRTLAPVVTWEVEASPVRAPVFPGQPIGTVYALVNSQVVNQTPLIAIDAVEEKIWWQLLLRWWLELWRLFWRMGLT